MLLDQIADRNPPSSALETFRILYRTLSTVLSPLCFGWLLGFMSVAWKLSMNSKGMVTFMWMQGGALIVDGLSDLRLVVLLVVVVGVTEMIQMGCMVRAG
ncbi:hypothetical protein FRB94_010241 [Tulasnella sp. JGI-2019a]|nr:hypothetical protein FRB94_010241 [Tulasnella sp. JGI-2019a]KAG9003154.1 hypothetical protein FRB93_011234 [Tulasnella sp. JGI-2019a]KAG9033980.1 hypothetical protein FRB95_013953 [Tulasnella sp. JGI-2019a]